MTIDVNAELAKIRERKRREAEAAGAVAPKSRPPKIVATPFVWRDPANIPPRAWLYSRHYIRKFVSCTVAPGSLGKSSLALVEAIAIARNLPLLGIPPTEQTNAWYWNGEDPQEETERRIAAICQHYDIDGRELTRHLFIHAAADPTIALTKSRRRIAFPKGSNCAT